MLYLLVQWVLQKQMNGLTLPFWTRRFITFLLIQINFVSLWSYIPLPSVEGYGQIPFFQEHQFYLTEAHPDGLYWTWLPCKALHLPMRTYSEILEIKTSTFSGCNLTLVPWWRQRFDFHILSFTQVLELKLLQMKSCQFCYEVKFLKKSREEPWLFLIIPVSTILAIN